LLSSFQLFKFMTGQIFRLFLWLGAISFGGPVAHIALMQREIVERRGWLSSQEFLDLSGAMSLIPGPNSTELAMALGQRRGGKPGLWAAGAAFILPAMLIVLAASVLYARYGQLALFRALFYGVQPVVIAIVAHALWKLLPTAFKSPATCALGAVAFALAATDSVSEIALIFAAAAIGLAWGWSSSRRPNSAVQEQEKVLAPDDSPASQERKAGGALFLAAASTTWASTTWASAQWLSVGWSFLKIGSVLYGSGYVLLAFLRQEFVPEYLSDATLLDAIAIGQMTPGPVFTTATFIGYQIDGLPGALAATAGIFGPSFLLVHWLLGVLGRVRAWPLMRPFLDCVNAASVALMGAVMLSLGRAALVDATTLTLAVISLALLLATKINSAWLIALGALVGAARNASLL
jgi:chromate transporter